MEWGQNGSYETDNLKMSFLLQIDLKEKMTLKKPEYAIYNHSDMGPIFGAGADLCIADCCNKR